MHRTLDPKTHGYIDYLIVAAFLLAPSLFDFSATPTRLSYILAIAHLGMTLLTAFPLGIIKAVPFTAHGAIELAVTVLALIAPWVFGFSYDLNARNFYVGSGIAFAIVWSLTDYRGASATSGRMAYHGMTR